MSHNNNRDESAGRFGSRQQFYTVSKQQFAVDALCSPAFDRAASVPYNGPVSGVSGRIGCHARLYSGEQRKRILNFTIFPTYIAYCILKTG